MRKRDVIGDGWDKVYVGRPVPGGDYRSQTLRLALNPQHPFQVTEIAKRTIEEEQRRSGEEKKRIEQQFLEKEIAARRAMEEETRRKLEAVRLKQEEIRLKEVASRKQTEEDTL